MEAKLIVVGGDVKTTEVNLKLPCIIGRGRGTGLMLPHPLVSRQHCEIYEHEQQLVVRDLGSLNGTYINNTRLTEPTLLPSGDLLTVGTVTFRAEYQMDPNLAPPTPSAKTVRGGAPTAQAKGKAPAAEPDFSSFEEIEEVEVEEYASGIVKDSASIPAMSSNDDIDIMSMLEDEIEEVVEAPKAPAKKPTTPSAPAAKKAEAPPDHGTKPTQAGNRWASPQAPAADANETLRARPGETKQSKPDKKGGPGKASAAATNSPVVAEKKPAEPVGDDADDFLASLGIAALAATAAPAVEQLAPQEEPANIATAAPDDVDEQVASHQGNGAAQHTAQHASPLDETLLPPEVAEDLADIDVIEEDVVEELAMEEVVIEEVVEEAPPPVAENDDSFLANLGLVDLPPHAVQEEPVAEDSLVAPQSALADPIDEAIAFEDVPLEDVPLEDVALEDVSLEEIAELEAAAEPVTPEALAPEPVAEDSLQAPLTSSFEPVEDVVELEDIELLDDVAELEAPAEPSPATLSEADDDFLSELGLSAAPPEAASHLEPTAEAVAEIPLPPAAESLVDERQAMAADEPIAPPAQASEDIEEVFELEEMEVVEEVAEVEAPAEPVSATDEDFLSELGLSDAPPEAPANWEPAAEAVAELPFIPPAESTIEEPEALAADEPIAPPSETSDDSEEVFELDEMEVVEEVAEVEAPAEPVSADDDFLSELGLSDTPPEAPANWEPAEPAAEVVAELPLPPAAESVDEPLPPVAGDDAHLSDLGLDEPIEIEEVFEVDEMEVVDEVEAPVAAAPLESPPATDADIDDFLADLGLEAPPAAPVEPAAELPPEMLPPEAALSEPVEVEEVFDLVEMEEIEEVEEMSLDAELPPPAEQLEETWLEAPAPSPGWGEPVAEDSLMAPLPLGSAEPAAEDEAAAAAEEVELSDIELVEEELVEEELVEEELVEEELVEEELVEEELVEEELVEEIDEAEELAEPVAVEASADSDVDVDSFLADLGLDDPLPAAPLAMESSVASEAVDLAEIDQVEEVVDLSVAQVEPIAPHIEPLLAFESVAELPEVEIPGAEMGASEALVEVDPLSASDSTIEPADAVVDLSDVAGVEEVFDLDVEEVSFDEVEPAAPAALPFASAIVPLVDTSLMAGEFLDESPTELVPAEESANNFASAPPLQSEEITDDMFAEQMFADLSADEPVSEIETLEEPGDIVEVPEEVAEDEPVAIAPAPVAAPRSLPTPLHVAKPYAYANPVARFPMARWTPPVDNGPIIEPVKFPHAAPRPHTSAGEAVTSVVLPLAAAMAAAPLAAAPLEEIEEVAELPVEEVPVEEVTVEEVTVEEVTVEEVTVEEVTVEEVTVEEVTMEEVTVEEVTMEELPGEEVPVHELAMIEELPASEEPEVVEEVAEVDEDLDAFLKDLGQ